MIILKDRFGLLFEFPRRADESIRKLFWLPLSHPFAASTKFEAETGISRLVSYDVINRNGTLFTHLGSKSRSLTLSFNLLGGPDAKVIPGQGSTGMTDAEGEKQTKKVKGFDRDALRPTTGLPASVEALKNLVLASNATEVSKFFVNFPNRRRNDQIEGMSHSPGWLPWRKPSWREFCVDLLRSLVTTNAENTVLGPPLIRIKWKSLHKSSLWVCNQVDFPLGEETLKTSMDSEGYPKNFPVKLQLSEVRATDNVKFQPNRLGIRDGVPGWDSVLDGRGWDPGDTSGL